MNVSYLYILFYLQERNKVICQRYWPESGHKQYHDIRVESVSTNVYSFYIERRFTLIREESSRTLIHLQYTNWPSHSVPRSADELLYLYHKVKALELVGPLLVHCSTGSGRTGVFIALDNLIEQSKSVQQVDVFKCVSDMRKHRCRMVSTHSQYRLIWKYHIVLIICVQL